MNVNILLAGRAVPRIFCLGEGVGGGGGKWWRKLCTPIHRGLLYTDRVSSWTFLVLPLHRKLLPLRPLKKSKYTDAVLC